MLVDREISLAVTGRHYAISKSMIDFVKENEDKVKRSVKATDPSTLKILISHCEPFLTKMERVLCMAGRWIWRLSWHYAMMCTCERT
jgi:hypothetical protein